MMKKYTNRVLAMVVLASCLTTPAVYGQNLSEHFISISRRAPSRADTQKRVAVERFLRTDLYFGMSRAGGPGITEEEWLQFLNEEITPRFPDGLTVVSGYGQFLNLKGLLIRETSKVVILLYPVTERKEKSNQIEQIRQSYKEQFQQESVLRLDSPRPVFVSF